MKKESRALTATQRAYLRDEVREMLWLRDKLDHDTATRLERARREGEARGRANVLREAARRLLAAGMDRDFVLSGFAESWCHARAEVGGPCDDLRQRITEDAVVRVRWRGARQHVKEHGAQCIDVGVGAAVALQGVLLEPGHSPE